MKFNRREFTKKACAASLMIVAGRSFARENTHAERGKTMEFDKLIEARRSVRKYAKSEMQKAEMEAIVAEALNAPSWKNTEVTRYYAALGDFAKNRMWKEALPNFNAASSANAAALVAVTFRKGESGYMGATPADELGEMWGAYDCGLASSYFILAAKDHGWDSLIMGIRDAKKVKEIFGIPDNEILMSVIAIGKSAQPYFKNPRKPVTEVLKIFVRTFLAVVSSTLACATTWAGRPEPNASQMKRIREGVEVYGIVHWGLNTYTDREWGFGDEDPTALNPPQFDADQIVGACRAGGLQGLIIVAKHHDGFCLWPTKTTTHNISRSPFRGGKGDYVKEMEQACRRHGLKFGVYVSPWDRNSPHYGTDKYVADVFQAQIRELLSGDYGEIFEMWFDGANGGDGYYGGARERRKIPFGYYRYETETFAMVRKLQPNVCIFNESDLADFRYGGNERGVVDPNSRSTGGHFDGVQKNYLKWANTGLVDGTTFLPIEADFPLRPGWFYHEKERGKTKCAAYLMQRYLATVGNAATLNLGIAPNREGRLDDEDVRALKGFGKLRRMFFSRMAKEDEPFNVVVMKEDVSRGERIDDWRLLADGSAILSGASIGIKRIRTLEIPCAAKSVELEASSRLGEPGKVEVIRYAVNPELLKHVLAATTESGETDTAKWMTKERISAP